jgi:phosphate transport system protein
MSYNKILDRDVARIKRDIIEIIEQTKSQYAKTFDVLKTRDMEKAKEIIKYDQKINDLQNDFTKMALWKIAKQQMVAGDLRLAIGGILISREVERIADYAKLICSFYIKYETEIENFEYISLLFDLVNKMLNTISLLVDNYEEAQEQKVVNLEMELNNKFKEFNNKMIAKMNEKSNDEKYVTKIVGIIRQLKNLERAGDHLINIEEILNFIRNGIFSEIPSHIES